jgi:DNA polymerase III alpha subunit
LPEAPLNAERLAEQCCYDVIPRKRIEPPAQVPLGHDAATYLRQLCETEITRHHWSNEQAARRRLDQEIQALCSLDFAGHCLLLGELASEAHRQGWPLTLRGSGGASLVCYLLALSQANPIRHALRFERFANPAREGPPDLDIDLATDSIDAVRAWLVQKYKPEHVGRVGMCVTFQERSALRAVAEAYGVTKEQMGPLMAPLNPARRSVRC